MSVVSKCEFPNFLRRPLPDGSPRHWITEMKYAGNTDQWTSQLEITVLESEIVAKIKFEAQCSDHQGGTVPCDHRELEYTRTCVREEGGGKYRVKHTESR